MKTTIVLDKSYLEAKGRDHIRQLCQDHQVLMVETLFLELLTTTEPKFRAACFRKFPPGENPVELIENVGSLLRYETETKAPASPILTRRLPIRFVFNDKMGAGTFSFSSEQHSDLKEWEAQIEEDGGRLKDCSAVIDGWFPTLSDYKPGQPTDEIDRLRRIVASDADFVRIIYAQIRHESFPEPDSLTPEWAFFRWVQVQLLTALEYIRRYGPRWTDIQSKEIPQDVADSHYVLAASLAGGFATCEKKLQTTFHLLRPDGLLLT